MTMFVDGTKARTLDRGCFKNAFQQTTQSIIDRMNLIMASMNSSMQSSMQSSMKFGLLVYDRVVCISTFHSSHNKETPPKAGSYPQADCECGRSMSNDEDAPQRRRQKWEDTLLIPGPTADTDTDTDYAVLEVT